jgi:hypothetical protein
LTAQLRNPGRVYRLARPPDALALRPGHGLLFRVVLASEQPFDRSVELKGNSEQDFRAEPGPLITMSFHSGQKPVD